MDAELHQGAGQVGRDLHQVVLGDVELLQLPQGAEGLLVDLGDLVVHEDQGLRWHRRPQFPACLPAFSSPLFLAPEVVIHIVGASQMLEP